MSLRVFFFCIETPYDQNEPSHCNINGISIHLLAFYHQRRSLIGYATNIYSVLV